MGNKVTKFSDRRGEQLWLVRTEFDKVECNVGHQHTINKVVDAVLVEIVEHKDVYGTWGGKLYVNGGRRAVSLDGSREFKSSWTSYDDASYSGQSWYSPEEETGFWSQVSEYQSYYDPDDLLPELAGSKARGQGVIKESY